MYFRFKICFVKKNTVLFTSPTILLVNKGLLNRSEIMLRKEKKNINDTKEIVQVLHDHYINIVERSCRGQPTSVAKQSLLTGDIKIVDHIVRHYEDHPSVRRKKER